MTRPKRPPAHGITARSAEAEAAALAHLEQLIAAGLCSNCRHLGDCGILPKTAAPILQCEMYECGSSLRPRLSLARPPKPADDEAKGEPADEELLGLCANCDHLRVCRLPKPPGGVWQCEEYA
jgi:hypothetical protein